MEHLSSWSTLLLKHSTLGALFSWSISTLEHLSSWSIITLEAPLLLKHSTVRAPLRLEHFYFWSTLLLEHSALRGGLSIDGVSSQSDYRSEDRHAPPQIPSSSSRGTSPAGSGPWRGGRKFCNTVTMQLVLLYRDGMKVSTPSLNPLDVVLLRAKTN